MGAAALAAFIVAGAALAAEPSEGRRAEAFESLLKCRDHSDPAARLACFDQAAARLAQAEQTGDIVVVDRDQARAARRQAFGFTLPALSIFERGEKPEELERLTAKVRSAHRGGDGKWVVELEDGAVWQQTDNDPIVRSPRQGSEAQIRRAAMGGYFMNLDGQRAVRARRVR